MRGVGILFVLFAVAGAGCGAASEGSPESIAAAASAALEQHETLRVAMWSEDADEPLRCDGAVDYRRERVHMSCVLDGETFELIAIDAEEYTRGTFAMWGNRTGAKRWQKAKGEDEPTSGFLDPREMLAELRRATVSSERLDRAEVRGTETTRYRLTIEPEKMKKVDLGETTELELWIDDDDLLRRMRGRDGDEGPYVVEFYAFGEPVEIEPPPAAEVEEAPADDFDAGSPCPGGKTAPLREADVVAAFRRHGLEVERNPGGCVGEPGVELALVGTYDVTPDEEALGDATLMCTLQRAGDGRDIDESTFEDDLLTLTLANLSCIYFSVDEKKAPTAKAEAAVRRAFEDLRRSLR
jgi:hypothetical protein